LELFDGYSSSLAVSADGALLTLKALGPLRQPDLLAYFSTKTPQATQLPIEAHLLGPVAWGHPRAFALPQAAAQGGHVVLYSLSHQQVTAVAELPSFTQPTPPNPPTEMVEVEDLKGDSR
jgi:hypothetical protein